MMQVAVHQEFLRRKNSFSSVFNILCHVDAMNINEHNGALVSFPYHPRLINQLGGA